MTRLQKVPGDHFQTSDEFVEDLFFSKGHGSNRRSLYAVDHDFDTAQEMGRVSRVGKNEGRDVPDFRAVGAFHGSDHFPQYRVGARADVKIEHREQLRRLKKGPQGVDAGVD
jgi:hypothetical protein